MSLSTCTALILYQPMAHYRSAPTVKGLYDDAEGCLPTPHASSELVAASLETTTRKSTHTVKQLFEEASASPSPSAEFIARQLFPQENRLNLLIETEKWGELDEIVASPLTSKEDIDHITQGFKKLCRGGRRPEKTTSFREFTKNLKTKAKAIKTSASTTSTRKAAHVAIDIQEYALDFFKNVNFSHATIAGSLTGGELTLKDLETSLRDKGWDSSKGHLSLYTMPDGSITSYDNRRLHVLKQIANSGNPPMGMTVPATISHFGEIHGKKKDIEHHKRDLTMDIGREASAEIATDPQVTAYREYLLGNEHELPFEPSVQLESEGQYLQLRIYRDAGKPEALTRAHVVKAGDFGVVYGYQGVRIR
ncbi:MAG: hypothetical protein ACI9S8_001114 [Chlamydiales bacterium]|jgi:hypothetical protein